MARGELELRCFCNREPLLAVCGRDARTGDPFVHVKAFKSTGQGRPARLFAEVVATSGVVRIRCRECQRWHKVTIKRERVGFRPERLPETITL